MKEKKERLKIEFNPYVLDLVVKSFFTTNHLANVKLFSNIGRLMDMAETEHMSKEVLFKTTIIKRLCQGVLKYRLVDKKLLFADITDGESEIITRYKSYLEGLGVPESDLSDDDIAYIDRFVSERLQYTHLIRKQDKILELFTNLKLSNYSSMTELVSELRTEVKDLNAYLQDVSVKSADAKFDFSTHDVLSMTSVMEQVILEETDSSSRIKTGVQILNAFFDGGWLARNVYMALGIPGKGKSVFLLNAAIWAAKYNKDLKPKDPTKIPAVLYVSMENHQVKTAKRILSYVYGNSIKHKIRKTEIGLQELVVELNAQLHTPVALEIKYRPNDTVSASDVCAMIDEYSGKGVEVVFVVLDYLGRMKSNHNVYNTADLRIKFGAISNELCTLAKDKGIPILSAGQINRVGESKIDIMQQGKKSGQINGMGRADLSESRLIGDNVDVMFGVHMEKTPDNEYVLGVKDFKQRDGTDTNLSVFFIKFEHGNTIKLVEDVNGEPKHLEKLEHSEISELGSKNSITTVEDIGKIGDSLDNLF